MIFFTKLFKKKLKEEIPPMPSWETVVEMMSFSLVREGPQEGGRAQRGKKHAVHSFL